MMPLKEQTTENKVEKKEDSGALKTEEILSLLSKTRQDFIKDQEILEKIPNLFKKKTLIELANNSENKKTKTQELEKPEILEKKENKEFNNESKTDKEEILEKKIDEKKYTEIEYHYTTIKIMYTFTYHELIFQLIGIVILFDI